MNNRALYLAVAACFVLTPTAALAQAKAAPEKAAPQKAVPEKAAPKKKAVIEGSSKKNACKSNKCDVHITVSKCDGKISDAKSTPDPIYIAKGNKATIAWIIDTKGYTFTEKGIGWKTAAGKGEFESDNPGSTEYTWRNRDKSTKETKFTYWIDLQGPDKKTCRKDPTVVNGVVVPDLPPAGTPIAPPTRPPGG